VRDVTAAEPPLATAKQLAGYTVAITAERRREELGAALARHGASVVYAPAIRIVPLEDDADVLAATRACLAEPLDVVVATTGVGFRGWVEAADRWGLADALRPAFEHAAILARGPKARGAIRAAGLREQWSPQSESSAEVLEHLLTNLDVTGKRIALQLHGEPLTEMVDALRSAGAVVIEVPVYRWLPPDDLEPLRRLIDRIVTGEIDCVTFTSAPAATSFLQVAAAQGHAEAVRRRLQQSVIAACVGPVTAEPLVREGIPVIQPARGRLGALVREIVEQLPQRDAGGSHASQG
jgi:uroporphyrinogen-III synthase